MEISRSAVFNTNTSKDTITWRKSDTMWMLGLYGTAIGAGVLFLPINAGTGGLIPLIIMGLLAFPMTFFAHRGLCRFILSSNRSSTDITQVVEEHFGVGMGQFITFLYFFTIYPILLVYSVAITNTVESFLSYQLHIKTPPRVLLALILIIGLMSIVRFGKEVILKTMSLLVYPFIVILMLLGFYLIPYWNTDFFTKSYLNITGKNVMMTMWLSIPVMVFSFNHSPIISAFTVAKLEEYGDQAEKKCSLILLRSHIMMVFTVMFFVFSCVLSLSPENLLEAKTQNISILSYLANHFHNPIMAGLAPIIAIIAITKSFLGHYLGAREGFNSTINKILNSYGKTANANNLNYFTTLFMLISTWLVATLDPSILGLIESLGGPIIAILLFLMPMYAINKVPTMRKYSGQLSNFFVVIIGLIALSSIAYNIF